MTLAKTTLAGALCAISLAAPLALAGTERPAGRSPAAYYLALGDSMAFGFQPTKATKPPSKLDPAAFRTGYVDVFAAQLRKLSPTIRVINYGCPGETTVTFAKGGCDWLKGGGKLHNAFRGSQLKAAEAFLRAHPGKVSPITVTLWGADLAPLSAAGKSAKSSIAAFASRFTPILARLRAAAPNAEIIVERSVEPGGRQAGEGRAPLPLGRCGHRGDRRRNRAPGRGHVRGANGPGNFKAQKARICSLTFYCPEGTTRIRPTPGTARRRAPFSPRRATSSGWEQVSARQGLRDLPDVPVGIGEGCGPYAPWPVDRSVAGARRPARRARRTSRPRRLPRSSAAAASRHRTRRLLQDQSSSGASVRARRLTIVFSN